MELMELSNRFNRIRDETMKLLKQMNILCSMGFHKFPESYEPLSLDVAMRGEHIACGLRHLVYTSSSIEKSGYMEQAGIVLRVQAIIEEYGVRIEIPALLPKRKKGGSCEFIIDPLHYELNRFVQEQEIERFRECVVVFEHVYNRALPEKKIRDYDNVLEPKKVLDVINTFLLTDDSGRYIDVHHTTSLENRDCTRIYIMSHMNFILWLYEKNDDRFSELSRVITIR